MAVQELAIETLLVTLAIPETATVFPDDGNIVLTFRLLDIYIFLIIYEFNHDQQEYIYHQLQMVELCDTTPRKKQ